MRQKLDIPLDQAVAVVRAAQKMNCDTADELFKMVTRRIAETHVERSRRITSERALRRILDLPKTSTIATAKHFARLGLPRRKDPTP